MYFLSQHNNSGIGQVILKYVSLSPDFKLVQTVEQIPDGSKVFYFMLPIDDNINKLKNMISRGCDVNCMSVCETETVHPDYEKIIKNLCTTKKLFVPSEFCKRVFEKQFDCQCVVLRHYVLHKWPVKIIEYPQSKPYVFYHIGNILDPRKNFNMILDAFNELKLDNCKLFIKATSIKNIKSSQPNIFIMNGLVEDEVLEQLHNNSHCYVSCSHSEGVGMGAVEAALHNKPVIISDYGGAVEYIKTPFLVRCEKGEIGFDDFLFKSYMVWGQPRYQDLLRHMKTCYDTRLTYMEHTHTHETVSISADALYQE